jgi:hypothetical protein
MGATAQGGFPWCCQTTESDRRLRRRSGELAEHIVIVVQGDSELFEVVFALGPTGGFASLLDGRQQQRRREWQ